MAATDAGATRGGGRLLALGGLLLVLVGFVGYFVVVFTVASWMPRLRNDAVPNLVLVAAGVALSALAVSRARGSRRVPAAVLATNVALAGLFAYFLFVMPAVGGAAPPAVGTLAPDFALLDEAGRTVRRDDFRGSPLLLVFYRGHW